MKILLSNQSWISFSISSIQTHFENSVVFQHKKIAAIVAIIFTGLVSCYLICRHYLLKSKKVVVLEDNSRALEDKLSDFLSIQEANFLRFSSSLINLQDIVAQYKELQKEWNDLTNYTEEELDQLLNTLDFSLGRKEFESTEALYIDLKSQFQVNHQRFKDAFEDHRGIQDLQKQFQVKEKELQLLKAQVENHQKQQKNLIQNVRDTKEQLDEMVRQSKEAYAALTK